MAQKKQIICQKCRAKLRFDPDKITSRVIKFKCPGCASVLCIRKPEASKEPLPSCRPTAPKAAKQQRTEIPESNDELNDELNNDSEVGPGGPGDGGAGRIADREMLHKVEHSRLISKDRFTVPEEPEEPDNFFLEDYNHEKLREYEEGAVDSGDLEWTRYAGRKGLKIPESKIDINVIPASADGLRDTLADMLQAEMYNLQGEHHLGNNLIKQAIRDFNHSLEINPNYVDALVNRGSAFALQNDYNAALADFNYALGLENKKAEIYNLRGEIYLHNRMYDEAINDFTAAIILNPIYSDAYLNRAKAYNEKGMTEEAKNDFNQAIRSNSEKLSNYVDLADSRSLFDEDSISS
jgi:tetratricopeptide (TPR) repeat protein